MGTPDSTAIIEKYFPALPAETMEKLRALGPLYREYNSKINVVSRADIDNLYERHILHSLALASFLGPLAEGTKLIDLGTGGGFPGIPMAILYPGCSFHLIDRIGKKIKVASEIAEAIGLKNVSFQHGDSGECRQKFDYVVSRAVMSLPALIKASAHLVESKAKGVNRYAPGIVCLKGGDLSEELAEVKRPVMDVPVSDFFSEPFFETKQIIYVPFVLGKKSK